MPLQSHDWTAVGRKEVDSTTQPLAICLLSTYFIQTSLCQTDIHQDHSSSLKLANAILIPCLFYYDLRGESYVIR